MTSIRLAVAVTMWAASLGVADLGPAGAGAAARQHFVVVVVDVAAHCLAASLVAAVVQSPVCCQLASPWRPWREQGRHRQQRQEQQRMIKGCHPWAWTWTSKRPWRRNCWGGQQRMTMLLQAHGCRPMGRTPTLQPLAQAWQLLQPLAQAWQPLPTQWSCWTPRMPDRVHRRSRPSTQFWQRAGCHATCTVPRA